MQVLGSIILLTVSLAGLFLLNFYSKKHFHALDMSILGIMIHDRKHYFTAKEVMWRLCAGIESERELQTAHMGTSMRSISCDRSSQVRVSWQVEYVLYRLRKTKYVYMTTSGYNENERLLYRISIAGAAALSQNK